MENKNIKLGDMISRGNIDCHGLVIEHKIKDYRVIGLNPQLKLQEILIINGFEELGEVEIFDWNINKLLRPLFQDNHFYRMFSRDLSHCWVGDF